MSDFSKIADKRYSSRAFDPERKVPKELLEKMIHAAHIAPSCYNEQPWHFIICDKEEHPEGYKKIFDSLVEFNQGWAKNAPILILIVADMIFSKNGKPNRWGAYDSGASAVSMMYEAAASGLMTHQMGGFDEKKVAASFELKEQYMPMAVMAVGFAASGDQQTPRDRRAVEKQFCFGSFC